MKHKSKLLILTLTLGACAHFQKEAPAPKFVAKVTLVCEGRPLMHDVVVKSATIKQGMIAIQRMDNVTLYVPSRDCLMIKEDLDVTHSAAQLQMTGQKLQPAARPTGANHAKNSCDPEDSKMAMGQVIDLAFRG